MNLEEIKKKITGDPTHTIGALLALFELQETDEQIIGATGHKNGIGFSSADAGFLSSLVRQYKTKGNLSPAQVNAAAKGLVKYAKQLANHGYAPVELGSAEQPPKSSQDSQEQQTKASACLEKGIIQIRFNYNPSLVAKVKTINGRRYHAESKTWSAPAHPDNIEQLIEWGFRCDRELMEILKKTDFEELPKITHIPGLKKELYPYQMAGVSFIESHNGRALIGDDMGLGKTPQALAWLQLKGKAAYPAIIVVPASVKLNWEREANRWMDRPKIQVVSGTKPIKMNADIIITNYDILAAREPCPKCLGKKVDQKGGKCKTCKGKGKLVGLRQDFAAIKPKTLILDECHYTKSGTADRTVAAQALSKIVKHIILLSGTPIVNRPLEFFNAINMVDPKLFPSYFRYGQRYCGATHNGFGWNFNGASNMQELHHKLTTTIMLRRLKKDVLKDLPIKQRATLPLEIKNNSEYWKAENNFSDWLRCKSPEKAEASEKAEALVKINYLKQLAVEAKLESCVEWIQDFIGSGEKLVVFAHHKKTVDTLMAAFKGVVVKIDGSVTSSPARQKAVDDFQHDDNIRLFVGTKAAAEGITLTAASNTCTIELQWQPGVHEQMEDRVHRIGQVAESVTNWYLLAANTIEEDIAELLDSKRQVMAQVLDGRDASEESMLMELLKKFKHKEVTHA